MVINMVQKPHSIVAVTVTPFEKDVKPNLAEIARQTESLAVSGAEVIFPNASTGEFVRMDKADKLAIMQTVAEANRGRKALFAGAADGAEATVYEFVEAAKKLEYDGCVICPPYYYGLEQGDVLRFYQNVCARTEGMPIYAYHVPFFTTGIEIPTFRKLMELPGLCGMKDSSANLKRISHLCDIARRERPDFEVYTGTDDCLLPALVAGCYGNMTALAASMPQEIAGIYAAFRKGDLAAATAIQRTILPIIREADSLPFPLGYKVLAKATGLKTEEFTDPRCADVLARIETLLKELRA